jgi:hypothetical protein
MQKQCGADEAAASQKEQMGQQEILGGGVYSVEGKVLDNEQISGERRKSCESDDVKVGCVCARGFVCRCRCRCACRCLQYLWK